MVHDPCNPIPSAYVPKGLPLHRPFAAVHVVGNARPTQKLQSHAITAIAPIYVGCDHRNPGKNESWRVNAVHFPGAVDVPATILMPSTNVSVATLSNALPTVIAYSATDAGIPVQMPDPSGAALFLFAAFIAWLARRFNTPRVIRPVDSKPRFRSAPVARLRHRSKSIAPYCAFRLQAS